MSTAPTDEPAAAGARPTAEAHSERLREAVSYFERVWRECERTRLMCQRQWEMISAQREMLRRLGPPGRPDGGDGGGAALVSGEGPEPAAACD